MTALSCRGTTAVNEATSRRRVAGNFVLSAVPKNVSLAVAGSPGCRLWLLPSWAPVLTSGFRRHMQVRQPFNNTQAVPQVTSGIFDPDTA